MKGIPYRMVLKRILFFGLILTCVCTVVEFCFRHYLFSSLSNNSSLKDPGLYADAHSENDYWILRSKWTSNEPTFTTHDELGWVGNFRPRSLRHYDAVDIRGRRPILLFGDSFSACAEGVQCFEDLLETTPFNTEYVILNYGVGGYGLDQIWMLMDKVLPLYPQAIVVIGIMSDDIDRAHLKMREASKPRFEVVDGALVQDHWVSDPLDVSFCSFVFRRVLFSSLSSTHFRSWVLNANETQQIKSQRATLLLESIARLTDDRDRIGIVFDPMRTVSKNWKTSILERFWTDTGVPFVSTRELAIQEGEIEQPMKLFREDGHPSTAFNRVILDEILRTLIEIQETP